MYHQATKMEGPKHGYKQWVGKVCMLTRDKQALLLFLQPEAFKKLVSYSNRLMSARNGESDSIFTFSFWEGLDKET